MADLYIKVGLKTQGPPQLEQREGLTIVKNLLIGDGFHWEQVFAAQFPGEIYHYFPDREIGHKADKRTDRNVTLINRLPLETYLECVVGSEMNPDAPSEFLKAHAVISRSWAFGKIADCHECSDCGRVDTPDKLIGWDDTSVHQGFDVCSDDHCQRYQGLQPLPSENLNAIRGTAGEILTSKDGELVDARFSKCCGGVTEEFSTCWQSHSSACLQSFNDPWCDLSSLQKNKKISLLTSILKHYDLNTEGYGFRWNKEISKNEIKIHLKQHFNRDIGEIEKLEVLHRGKSGRIDLLRLHGSVATLDIGKELWIRRIFSHAHLYSSAFDIEDRGAGIRLSGKGWGHGVGLCQIGAANMAINGYDYKSILSFYYPDSIISKKWNCAIRN